MYTDPWRWPCGWPDKAGLQAGARSVKLHEFQAKRIFAEGGIPVPKSKVADTPQEADAAARELGGRVAVKAQVHVGGRGKAGGIKLAADPADRAPRRSRSWGRLKGLKVKARARRAGARYQAGYYLGITIDRTSKRPVFIASAVGGIDIEQVARETPEKIVKIFIDPAYCLQEFEARRIAYGAGFDPALGRAVAGFATKLWTIFARSDASLCEINPLVVTGDGSLVAPTQAAIDDNAMFASRSGGAARDRPGGPVERRR